MSLPTLLASVIGRPSRQVAETMEYDALFKGRAGQSSVAADSFLPGLRPVRDEVDSYFREVFVDPLF